MLAKIQKEKAQGICVIPNWPTQSWYAKAFHMMTKGTNLHQGEKEPTQFAKSFTRNPSNLGKNESHNMPLIWENLEMYELSNGAKEIIMALWRPGTAKQYKTY